LQYLGKYASMERATWINLSVLECSTANKGVHGE
ncbi:hypothetical protein T07_819, partial [Trichinella nelsoni]